MKHLTSLLLLLCVLSADAQNLKFGKPTAEELNMTVYDADTTASAVVLCDITKVDYNIDFFNFTITYEVKKRIKILKDDGKKYANISISYINNEKEELAKVEIQDFKATVYNAANGKVAKTKIGEERLFKKRVDEEYMIAQAAIPQVKTGSVIEYEYTLQSNMFYHIADWAAQSEIPVAYASYRVEIPALFIFNVETTGKQQLASSLTQGRLNFKTHTDDMAPINHCNTNIYQFTGTYLPALKKDDYVWNVYDYATKVTAELKLINDPRGGSHDIRKTWEQIDDALLEHMDFGDRLFKKSKFYDELMASGIAGMSSVKEKVEATYDFLRQRISWNGEYSLKIQSASDVVKRGSGTNADLNMMLINMLGDVGVQAVPVVMSTRTHGKLPKSYPSLNKLNTFIVGIYDGGLLYYMDAAAADGYLNVLPPDFYVEQARIIQKGQKGRWINLQNVGESITQVNVNAAMQPDGEVKGERNILYMGNASLKERKAFREASDSATFIASKSSREGYDIVSCKMAGHRAFAPEVREEIQFVSHAEATADHIYYSPFAEVPVKANPFAPDENRLLPVEFSCRQNYSMNIHLKLPDGWQLEEKPENSTITTYDRSITGQVAYEQADDKTLNIQYQFRLARVNYDSKQYPTLRQLFDLLANRSKDVIVLKKL